MSRFGNGAFQMTAIVGFLLILVASFSALAEGVKSPGRNWTESPAIVELDTHEDVYAVGDIHGDYETLAKLLAGGGIISNAATRPEKVQWAAGKAVLICTGDLIDRSDHALQVISCLQIMADQAAKAGGRVIVTMGNHEMAFLATAGGDRIVKEFDKELETAGITPADVVAGRDSAGIGRYLLNLPLAARVNDWFFCHAGNTHGLAIKELAARMQAGIDTKGFAAPIVADPDSILQARMHPRPWWEAAATPALKDAEEHPKDKSAGEKLLRGYVAALGVTHLVFGHQPKEVEFADKTHRQAGEMFTKFDGLIFMIDTGMSRGVDGNPGGLLKIHQAEGRTIVTAISADARARSLWSGKAASASK
jgi:hypothetical protein